MGWICDKDGGECNSGKSGRRRKKLLEENMRGSRYVMRMTANSMVGRVYETIRRNGQEKDLRWCGCIKRMRVDAIIRRVYEGRTREMGRLFKYIMRMRAENK